MTTFTIVVPVYKNEESIDRLLDEIGEISGQLAELGDELELVTVVDGSPDQSYAKIQQRLPDLPYRCRLIGHSRNFGSFAAIRTGLAHGTGEYFGVMAADLQEPPHLMVDFARELKSDDCDVVVGRRVGRDDSRFGSLSARLFWGAYRRFIVRDMPSGGVDVFGCTREFRDRLLELEESRSSLVGLIFWLGFNRKEVEYTRLKREEGVSAWTFRKKLSYMSDSIFSFTDWPVRLLVRFGFIASVLSIIGGTVVMIGRLSGDIQVPGYAALMLVTLTFGSVTLFSIGLVGEYARRAYENTKQRPASVVARRQDNGAGTA